MKLVKQKIFCAIRKKWVTSLPEEEVRQGIIKQLIETLGYPKEAIAVEIALKELPHLSCSHIKIPKRRVDILCYGRSFVPQLLIECKAVSLNDAMLRQMMGYNYYVQASYVSIANYAECWTAKIDEGGTGYQLFHGLPSYQRN
jgi:hypothetical protein